MLNLSSELWTQMAHLLSIVSMVHRTMFITVTVKRNWVVKRDGAQNREQSGRFAVWS
jgi:hypothetical protein